MLLIVSAFNLMTLYATFLSLSLSLSLVFIYSIYYEVNELNLFFSMHLFKSAREVSKFASVALVDNNSNEIQVYVKYFDITFIPSTVFFFNAHHMKMDFGYPSPSSYFWWLLLFFFNKTLVRILWLYITVWVHGLSSRDLSLHLFWEIINMMTVFFVFFLVIKLFQ